MSGTSESICLQNNEQEAWSVNLKIVERFMLLTLCLCVLLIQRLLVYGPVFLLPLFILFVLFLLFGDWETL